MRIPALFVALLCAPALAAEPIIINEALALEPVGRGGRTPIIVDPIAHARATGTWKAPREGDAVKGADGREHNWTRITTDATGNFNGRQLAGGYVFATIESDSERVCLLDAAGHGLAFVNDMTVTGDPYSTGIVTVPVLLKQGTNELLFAVPRGSLRARLLPADKQVQILKQDMTLPDFRSGQSESLPAAVVVANCGRTPLTVSLDNVSQNIAGVTAIIPPLSVRKLQGTVKYDGSAEAASSTFATRVNGETLDEETVTYRVVDKSEPFKRTFVSGIDGSVQYYAVNPCNNQTPGDQKPAMFLSLHGAGVEALGQAQAYSSKSWGHIVCPTNRRPFGFDWEDWGRIDAMEVLAHASKLLGTDPTLQFLTGHSMGGHGTWQLGALLPDRFAAIGPSAGWISFDSYSNARAATQPSTRPGEPVRDMFRRAALPSRTLEMKQNYAQLGIYILHGDADDNVPVTEAREMVSQLKGFHRDFAVHEEPGAGHWWENSDEPGAECVDWAPMFDFFARHRLPASGEVRQVEFVTPNPGVSSRCHWIVIEQLSTPGQTGSVSIRFDPHKRRFAGTTANVARLTIDLPALAIDEARIELDGDVLQFRKEGSEASCSLERLDGRRKLAGKLDEAQKSPARSGPFKDAFRNRMIFVYGTAGTDAENQWSLNKARYDAQTWWYRGNGAVDVVSDEDFLKLDTKDRGVVLYGNRDTNLAWGVLLSDSPVQVTRSAITVGGKTVERPDLACLFVRPRKESAVACVAVVGGTGLSGLRVADRMPLFLSGASYPDLTIAGADMLTDGTAGVVCAGFFGNDWSVERGQITWQSP